MAQEPKGGLKKEVGEGRPAALECSARWFIMLSSAVACLACLPARAE